MHKARVAANRYYWQKLYNTLDLDKEFKLYLSKDECLRFMDEDDYNMIVNPGKFVLKGDK